LDHSVAARHDSLEGDPVLVFVSERDAQGSARNADVAKRTLFRARKEAVVCTARVCRGRSSLSYCLRPDQAQPSAPQQMPALPEGMTLDEWRANAAA
jgi:hypothetical protein